MSTLTLKSGTLKLYLHFWQKRKAELTWLCCISAPKGGNRLFRQMESEEARVLVENDRMQVLAPKAGDGGYQRMPWMRNRTRGGRHGGARERGHAAPGCPLHLLWGLSLGPVSSMRAGALLPGPGPDCSSSNYLTQTLPVLMPRMLPR